MRRLFPIFSCLLVACSIMAQEVVPQDSLAGVCGMEHKFKATQLIVPGSLVTLGAVGIAFHEKLGEWGSPTHTGADNYIQYVPVAANLFLGSAGVRHKHSFVDRVIISVTAYAIEAALVNGLKYTAREARPGADGRKNSFPSGHSATAFTGAELVRKEYGWGYGSAAYAIAIATGVLRVTNHKHWCNDVLAGAGIGILSVNAAYWLYPLEKKLFRTDRNRNKSQGAAALMVMPTYEPFHNTVGFSLNATL